MNKSQASQLLGLVSNFETMRLLNLYVDFRIEALKDSLVTAPILIVPNIQAAIAELKRIKTLHEEVLAKKEEK